MGRDLTTKNQTKEGKIRDIASRENIPPEGVTILGGNPYINVSGLDCKVKNKCKDEDLIHKSTEIIEKLQEPKPENKYLCGRKARISFFDRNGYMEAIEHMENPGREQLQELREMFLYTYEAEGWSSPDSCEAIAYTWKKTGKTYHDHWGNEKDEKIQDKMLLENVIMMAERRATNRAKREATGTGLTSVEEAHMTGTVTVITEQEQDQQDIAGIEDIKNQILLELKADVFTDEERKSKENNMGAIRSLAGLKGMLKGIQRELNDRQAAIKEEKKTSTIHEMVGIQMKIR